MIFRAERCFYVVSTFLAFLCFSVGLFENRYLTINKIKPIMVHR